MNKINLIRTLALFVVPSVFAVGCTPEEDYDSGESLDLTPLLEQVMSDSTERSGVSQLSASVINGNIPTSRDDLNSLRTVVKIFKGDQNAGMDVPGFGGLQLGKKETSFNVYYIETKVVNTGTDTVVYGIGYSVHYLFKKLKRGISVSNMATVAASAQLQSNKTEVNYSLQTFGITSTDLVHFFKPQVNSNFDVDGFGVIQSSIDGIHNVLSDSLLSDRTNFSPMVLGFIDPAELVN